MTEEQAKEEESENNTCVSLNAIRNNEPSIEQCELRCHIPPNHVRPPKVGFEALAEILSARLDRRSMVPPPGSAAIAPRQFLNVELSSGGSWPKGVTNKASFEGAKLRWNSRSMQAARPHHSKGLLADKIAEARGELVVRIDERTTRFLLRIE